MFEQKPRQQNGLYRPNMSHESLFGMHEEVSDLKSLAELAETYQALRRGLRNACFLGNKGRKTVQTMKN